MNSLAPVEALSDDELDELSAYLSSDNVPDSTLSLEGVDGLMCALQIPSDDSMTMDQWLPIIWGADEDPDVVVPQPDARMLELLERHWHSIGAAFPRYNAATDDGYWPLMYLPEDDTPDDATDTDYGREWAVGFRIGMDKNAGFWDQVLQNEQLSSGLTPIVLLDMGLSPDNMDKEIDYGTRQELVGALIPALHAYWAVAHGPVPTRH